MISIPARHSVGLHLLAIGLLTLAAVHPAAAQELGVALGRGTSEFAELGNPASLAVHAHVPILHVPYLRLEGGYRHAWDDDRRSGTTCDFYWPRYEGCVDEPIAYETRLTQLEVGLGLGVALLDQIELRGAVLITHNSLDASSRGAETNRHAGNYYPDHVVWSTAFEGGVAWTPWLDGRLGVVARFRRETLNFEGCATDVGAPFCGKEGLETFEVGAVLSR